MLKLEEMLPVEELILKNINRDTQGRVNQWQWIHFLLIGRLVINYG